MIGDELLESFSMSRFLFDLLLRARVPVDCLMAGVIYLHRMRKNGSFFNFASDHFEQIVTASVMIASKWILDDEVKLEAWALAARCSSADLARMEIEVLCGLQWNLYVDGEDHLDIIAEGTRLLNRDSE